MKKLNVVILSALLAFSFTTLAEGTPTDHSQAPTETRQKDVKKGRVNKGKKVKPLTEAERKELTTMQDSNTNAPPASPTEKEEVK